ncbi:MAG: hypothetical protein GY913_23425 [Proteobacteria bacterium]|nr:hypothetical protein [Pseudomonadota bacterium]MCP4919864.1 hypothetical protein [Pseudomonadota bacterium]
MWSLLLPLSFAQDVSSDEFGESVVEEVVPVNPETIAAAADEQARIDAFYDEGPAASESASSGLGDTWMFVLGAAGLGLLFVARKKVFGHVAAAAKKNGELVVVARQGLGHQGGLILLEASTGDGGTRRLLVGVSAGTTPALVADLGGDFAGFIEEDIPAPVVVTEEPVVSAPFERIEAPAVERTPVVRPVVRTEAPAPLVDDNPRPKRALVGRFTDADLAPLPDEGWGTPSGLDEHLSLVDEVLAGRAGTRH